MRARNRARVRVGLGLGLRLRLRVSVSVSVSVRDDLAQIALALDELHHHEAAHLIWKVGFLAVVRARRGWR